MSEEVQEVQTFSYRISHEDVMCQMGNIGNNIILILYVTNGNQTYNGTHFLMSNHIVVYLKLIEYSMSIIPQ